MMKFIVITIVMSILVLGCGSRITIVKIDRLDKNGCSEQGWEMTSNYSGSFEAEIDGVKFKGKKEAIQYPDIKLFDLNFGKKDDK